MVNRRLALRSCILLALTASLAGAGPIGSIFFNSLGNPGDVQLILNGSITINASNTGWYTSANTTNEPGGANYITGLCSNCGGPTFRDFFAFNIPGETTVTTATLNINTYIYDSINATETLGLFDVSTPLATLLAGTGGLAAYNDFGSGVSYGSRVYTAADQNLFRTISLNAAGIAAIQQSTGGTFVMGGALQDQVVPEPSTCALMASALGLLAAHRATKRRRRT
jgi:hypothetical protein